jgi:Mg-chelatase subunit ChlD
VDAVVAALTSDAARDRVRQAGFRDRDGGSPADAGPDTGVQAEAPTALDLDPAAVQQLLGRLASVATPSRLLAVIDVSTSMEAPVGDGTRATLARDAAAGALSLLPDAASVGIWAFAHQLDGDTDWQELAPLERLDVELDGTPRREALSEVLDTIPGRLDPGGTALYDTTLAAVRAARDAYDPTSVNTVVLITDGENDDDAGIGLPELLDTLRAEADPARPVKVVGIALGPDADLDALQQIGDATAGAAYPALDPEDLQSVLFDAIRRRG